MDRDVELRIKGHSYEISELNDEVLGSRQGYPMSEEGYRKTFVRVIDVAGLEFVDEMAAFIKEYIREREERPTNRDDTPATRHATGPIGTDTDGPTVPPREEIRS